MGLHGDIISDLFILRDRRRKIDFSYSLVVSILVWTFLGVTENQDIYFFIGMAEHPTQKFIKTNPPSSSSYLSDTMKKDEKGTITPATYLGHCKARATFPNVY